MEKIDVDALCEFLSSTRSLEQARERLAKLNKDALKETARHYNLPVLSKDSKATLTDRIIDTTVGAKLKFDTLLYCKLN